MLKEALVETPVVFHVVVVGVIIGLVEDVRMYIVDGNSCRLVVEDVVVDEHLCKFVRADVLFIIERDKTFFDSEEGGVEV